jgi:hypothetical protein
MSALTSRIVADRISGHTLEEIAADIGIPVVDVVAEWTAYVAGHTVETQEERWLLHLLRLEGLLKKVNIALESYENIEDFEVMLKLLDRIELLQSLNHARKEVAEREADKANRLLAEQVIGIITATHNTLMDSLETAFNKHKVGKVARETILTDMGEKVIPKALKAIEAEIED